MTLSQFRDHFLTRYKLECLKRGVKEISLENSGKVIAMMAYNAMSDVQSRIDVIEKTTNIILTGSNLYNLPLDFGTPKLVMLNNLPLCKRTTSWISKNVGWGIGCPANYSIIVGDIIADIIADDSNITITDDNGQEITDDLGQRVGYNILLSPIPAQSIVGNSLFVSYAMNIDLFNPANDKDVYYNPTIIFPSIYDEAILRYMVDSMFYNELKSNYEQEMSKLRVKQFDGEKIEYHWD